MSERQWNVPVVDVTSENFNSLWPSMCLAIKTSSFIGLDVELSGLGERTLLNARNLDDRYRGIAETARTRSILSFGVSCFKVQVDKMSDASVGILPGNDIKESNNTTEGDIPENKKLLCADMKMSKSKCLPFSVQTFNITVLCQENYVVEPISLEFLVDHGFDFNKQYSKGVHYRRGNQPESDNLPSVRSLFTEVILSKVPIIVHNGLVDLIFIYHNFYANIPSKLSTFLADISQIFQGGIYDTKYIVEYKARMPASYLEYVFKKSQRDIKKASEENRPYVSLQYVDYSSVREHVLYRDCSPDYEINGQMETICDTYANHGWCQAGRNCTRSHCVDLILNSIVIPSDRMIKKRKRRKCKQRKRTKVENDGNKESSIKADDSFDEMEESELCDEMTQQDSTTNAPMETATIQCCPDISMDDVASVHKDIDQMKPDNVGDANNQSEHTSSKPCGHRAGFDAFMTGYVMAAFIQRFGVVPKTLENRSKIENYKIDALVNRIYLVSKDMPLHVSKSQFAKTSVCHQNKWIKIHSI